MMKKKYALLLFCKPPLPGLVKTRLTEEQGGTLTNAEAAEFFKCSLLDVAEVAMLALDDLADNNASERKKNPSLPIKDYDFFVSTLSLDAVATLKELFKNEGPWSHDITYLVDEGASFDEHFDDAFDQIFSQGYESVVSVGGDMPLLPREHVRTAFQWLDYLSKDDPRGYAFVQAPCQQSGVSLVGMTKNTPMRASGVYYNTSGLPVLDAYTKKLQDTGVPNAFLNPVSDVDNDADLAHAISCLNSVAEASYFQEGLFLARRVLEWVDRMGLQVTAPPNDEHDPRQYIDVSV